VWINDFKAIEAAILKNKAYDELDKLADLANKNHPNHASASHELACMKNKAMQSRASNINAHNWRNNSNQGHDKQQIWWHERSNY
jgi:hypothetical protein